jgi:hypothetical protein
MFARSTACLSDGFSSGRDGQGKLMLARAREVKARQRPWQASFLTIFLTALFVRTMRKFFLFPLFFHKMMTVNMSFE